MILREAVLILFTVLLLLGMLVFAIADPSTPADDATTEAVQ